MTIRLAAGAEQAKELLAQGGSARDVEFAAERGDDVAALRPAGNTQASNAVGDRLHHRPAIRWAGQAAWCTWSLEASAATRPASAAGAFRASMAAIPRLSPAPDRPDRGGHAGPRRRRARRGSGKEDQL